MPALEPVGAWHVVAAPAAIDAARWVGDDVDVLRIAPDEALGLGATGVQIDDPEAIVEPEAGFSVALLEDSEERDIRAHIEWDVEAQQGLRQGKIAGVPAKLVIGEPSVIVVQTCYVDDLRSRLGW